jgi:hypothetical protein
MQVLRNILAAVLGYVVMFAVAFVLFSLTWMVLGADGSFEPGGWGVTGAWIGTSIVLGVIVSIAGGFACSKLAPSYQGVAILIGLVIVVGIVAAMPEAPAAAVRPEGVSMFEAMSSARQPGWLLWLNPVFGVIGVVLGAKLEGGRSA